MTWKASCCLNLDVVKLMLPRAALWLFTVQEPTTGSITDRTSFSRISGQCWKITTVLEKTDEPGKYTACESQSL